MIPRSSPNLSEIGCPHCAHPLDEHELFPRYVPFPSGTAVEPFALHLRLGDCARAHCRCDGSAPGAGAERFMKLLRDEKAEAEIIRSALLDGVL